jgi:hypothetical protein
MVTSVDEDKGAAQKQQKQQQLPQQPVQTMKDKMMATASFQQFQAVVHAKVRCIQADALLQGICSLCCG